MPDWRQVLICAAFLPGLAGAADRAMLELLMPDAQFVVDIQLARLAGSPIGQAVRTQARQQLQNVPSGWQAPMLDFSRVDWLQYTQEVIVAGKGGQGKDAVALAVVRGHLDAARLESLHVLDGARSEYLGVTILSPRHGKAVVAFLDGSIAVGRAAAEVVAALSPRGRNGPLPGILAGGLERFADRYDAWIVSAGLPAVPAKSPARAAAPGLDGLEAFNGGLRLTPDLEISADLTMRSDQDAAALANSMRLFPAAVVPQGGLSLNQLTFKADGRHVSILVSAPEKELLAAIKQWQAGQLSPAPVPAMRAPGIHIAPADPPVGSIRVQSSPGDMGTVLLPAAKSQ